MKPKDLSDEDDIKPSPPARKDFNTYSEFQKAYEEYCDSLTVYHYSRKPVRGRPDTRYTPNRNKRTVELA